MLKKYELSFIMPYEYTPCMYKIQQEIDSINTEQEFYDILLSIFLNRTYEFKKYIGLFNGEFKIHKVRFCKLFCPFETSEDWKNYLLNKLESYQDIEESLYGSQTYNNEYAKGALFKPSEIFKGRNKSWVFKNGLNRIMLVEHLYDPFTNERLYDCSEFLEKLCNDHE